MRLGILTSHPIQYQAPWFRALAQVADVEVFFAHNPAPIEQGEAGFRVAFEWDIDLLSGYEHCFLKNVSAQPGLNGFFGCDTPEIKEVIRTGKYDAFIVNGWHLKSYLQTVRACRHAGVPVLVRGDSHLQTPRSFWTKWAKEVIYRVALRQFDGFLFVGQRNREYLEHYGVPAAKMFFVPHFVDNEWFAKRAAAERPVRARLRAGWGADDRTFVPMFVGKFLPRKRASKVLHGAAHLQRQGIKTVPVFVGDGPLLEDCRREAQELGIIAHFAGFKNQTELPRYYAAADALALPSDEETWGLVVNEAMASGLPVIASHLVGCTPDLIDGGRTGLRYQMGDLADFYAKLQTLAEMKLAGYDFAPALADKMRRYSVEAATTGTMHALETLTRK